MKGIQILGIAMILGLLAFEAKAEGRTYGEVQDHYKTIFVDEPTVSRVCSDSVVGGDKTGDTIIGAIIGGVTGKVITKDDKGAAVGAVIGGMVGHDRSDANGSVVTKCQEVTTYNRVSRTVYSHSTVTFVHNGREYKLNFQK